MATKTATNKSSKSNKSKKDDLRIEKLSKNSNKMLKHDDRLSSEQKKNRDKMLEVYANCKNEDLKNVIDVYNNANEEIKENMRRHYEINGSVLINAIFNGNKQLAHECIREFE